MESNKDVVRRYYDCINRGDLHAVEDLLTDDHRRFLLSTREWWTKEKFMEVERVSGLGAGLFREPLRVEVEVITAEEDRVAVVARGFAVTRDGLTYNQMYHNLYKIRNGQIAEVLEFNDTKHVFDVIRRGPSNTVGLPE